MKADLTRVTFHPSKHFTRVLMQQGRVQLDADWNEQAAILTRYLRAIGADIIGPCGGPSSNLGFRILALNPDPTAPVTLDFAISRGHFYVKGILCDNTHEYATFQLPQGIQGTTLTMTPDRSVLDGAPLQTSDYVELSNTSSTQSPIPAVVTKVSGAAITLTVDTDKITKWGQNPQPQLRRLLVYSRQPELPLPKSDLVANPQIPKYLVYVDVWERLITFVEDDEIREVALGGPDTAARAKLICQVRWTDPPPRAANQQLADVVAYLEDKFQPRNRGMLKARVPPGKASTDPCIISPISGYRGPENQLYRVEIHTGSLNPDGTIAKPTFTWSRENGSAVFPILAGGGTNILTLETLGRDDRFGLAEGDWVEVEDDDYVLWNRAGTLLQVQSIDRSTMQVTLSGSPDPGLGNNLNKHPLLRRWDQHEGDASGHGLTLGPDNAVLIEPGVWLNLEDGVQILFYEPDPTTPVSKYRTGDYWLIPARVATGDVEWPTFATTDAQGKSITDQVPLPPNGVTHYYAPLGMIAVDNNGTVTPDSTQPPSFNPAVPTTWP